MINEQSVTGPQIFEYINQSIQRKNDSKSIINIWNQVMKVTICKKNIDQYRSGTFPEIEEIRWRLNYLDGEVLKNLPNLEILNCSYNQLTNLRGLENCTQLRELNCSHNQLINLQGLENCTQLQKLDCSYNQLANLQGLENCTQSQRLYCSFNELINLQGLENCTQLQKLDCFSNQLTNLQGLENCTQLQKLDCSYNRLINLRELENCIQLQKLDCSYNRLINLRELENCIQLQTLYCYDNQITDFLPIVYLTQLTKLLKHNNPLNPPTIQEERFLTRLQNRRTANTIYSDKQNVHNTTIQKSIIQSTTNLLKDPKPPKPDFTQLSAQAQTLLQTYLQDKTPHSILLITYEELFSYVWARILKSPNKDTLVQILEQELQDSTGMCYTGRFNRTINTLNGFYDDIEVQISDPDRINAIIQQHKDKDKIIQALQEAGYDEQTIGVWTADL